MQTIVLDTGLDYNHVYHDYHGDLLQVIGAVKELWNERLVQNFMYTQDLVQHDGIAQYVSSLSLIPDRWIYLPTASYLNDAERILDEQFVPSDMDILGLWTQSTGIYRQPMTIEGVAYDVYDLGGARSEWRKWAHSFQAVDCVIFTVGLSDYNMHWSYGMVSSQLD